MRLAASLLNPGGCQLSVTWPATGLINSGASCPAFTQVLQMPWLSTYRQHVPGWDDGMAVGSAGIATTCQALRSYVV